MEIDIPTELELSEEIEVRTDHSAKHIGSGSVEVLSTPSMILFMEQTARKAIDQHLPNSHSSVGTRVCVEHKKAVPIGAIVRTHVVLRKRDRSKITFDVELRKLSGEIVGEGTHDRFIINEDKFKSSIQ